MIITPVVYSDFLLQKTGLVWVPACCGFSFTTVVLSILLNAAVQEKDCKGRGILYAVAVLLNVQLSEAINSIFDADSFDTVTSINNSLRTGSPVKLSKLKLRTKRALICERSEQSVAFLSPGHTRLDSLASFLSFAFRTLSLGSLFAGL